MKAPKSIPDEVKTAQYILVTHGHFDHFVGALPLVKENANTKLIVYGFIFANRLMEKLLHIVKVKAYLVFIIKLYLNYHRGKINSYE